MCWLRPVGLILAALGIGVTVWLLPRLADPAAVTIAILALALAWAQRTKQASATDSATAASNLTNLRAADPVLCQRSRRGTHRVRHAEAVTSAAPRDRGSLHYPIEPMIATSVDEIPVGPAWCYQPKWDGWRCLGWVRESRVQLQTRAGKPISAAFPDITRALRATLPPGTVVDGELLVWDSARERSSFALLQRRAAAGRRVLQLARQHPAHLVLFDVLATAEESLLPAPLAERRAVLEQLLAGAPPPLVLCPQTTDPAVAGEWVDTWTSTGIEGVLAKRLDQPYRIGRSGWRKYRVRTTAEAVIGGVTGWTSAPQTVLVGQFDARGRLRYTGRSTPLTDDQRAELAPLLERPVAQRRGAPVAHPWPQPLPASWSGSWERPAPVRYVQVQPAVVAEVLVDTAFEHGRYRHRVQFVRPRRDLSVYDVPILGVDE